MRFYILTEKERNIIEFYIEQDQKLEGLRELKHALAHTERSRVAEDLEFIREFQEKNEDPQG